MQHGFHQTFIFQKNQRFVVPNKFQNFKLPCSASVLFGCNSFSGLQSVDSFWCWPTAGLGVCSSERHLWCTEPLPLALRTLILILGYNGSSLEKTHWHITPRLFTLLSYQECNYRLLSWEPIDIMLEFNVITISKKFKLYALNKLSFRQSTNRKFQLRLWLS